jgi:hypothetical protein
MTTYSTVTIAQASPDELLNALMLKLGISEYHSFIPKSKSQRRVESVYYLVNRLLPWDTMTLAEIRDAQATFGRVGAKRQFYLEDCESRGINPDAPKPIPEPKGAGPFGSTYTGD